MIDLSALVPIEFLDVETPVSWRNEDRKKVNRVISLYNEWLSTTIALYARIEALRQREMEYKAIAEMQDRIERALK